MINLDRFHGEYQEVPAVGYCCKCEETIYQGDDIIETDGGLVCEGCADEYDIGVKGVAGMSDGMSWDRG